MRIFVDTSAFLAVLDADDRNHRKAKTRWVEFVSSGTS
ncbi:MAG: VapC toxin family PIN domain ribonuclease, partial [Deltaproteobacteria bacterium]|nr:VapC toxin family PIN domain ribonuclease [Deltaproteobacteria bacterium]